MILVIATLCYTVLASVGHAPDGVLTTLGALLVLGFGFFFKDKAAEKVQVEASKTEVAKIEAAGQAPCLVGAEVDDGLATMGVDKIRPAMSAAGMSEEQALAFLKGLGMNPVQTQAAVTAVKQP
jgi:hypothetical protein